MNHLVMSVKHGALALAFVACSSAKVPMPSSTFEVTTDNVTDFDATVHDGAAWAHVVVRYTPSTTYYELTTSHGPVALAGTEVAFSSSASDPIVEDAIANLLSDSRATDDGYVILTAGDPEYDLVDALLDHLVATGTSQSPSIAEKGTTRYGAAYTCARVLALLEDDHLPNTGGKFGGGAQELPTLWPYPGYDDAKLMPAELAPEGIVWGISCCGPNNCTHCEEYNWGFVCGDWCAAGDHCNAYHRSGRRFPNGGGCGQIATWPGHCPHQDSKKINSYGSPINYCSYHVSY